MGVRGWPAQVSGGTSTYPWDGTFIGVPGCARRMEITLTGTGSPIPYPGRGGTSVVLEIADEPILVDCGQLAVHRMLEARIDPTRIETLFFTHTHVDHTADFFQFVIATWSLGREALTVYGPEGTEAFVDAIPDLYADDIAYRKWFADVDEAPGIEEIDVVQTTPDLDVERANWSVTALPVEHSIETYAYRFEDDDGNVCVISGDTRKIDALAEFAADADVLIQDACIGPVDPDPPADEDLLAAWHRGMSDEMVEKHRQNHCDPTDAGEIAQEAGVDTLVLTHHLPNRDFDAMRADAEAAFDGEVVVAEDGLSLSL